MDLLTTALVTSLLAAAPVPANAQAWRARIAVGADGAATSWVDVAVPDGGGAAQRTCEAVVRHELERLVRGGAPARVVRGCEKAVLPATGGPGAGALLVQPFSAKDVDLLLDAVAQGQDAGAPFDPAEVTVFTRFASGPDCDAARARVLESQRQANLQTEEAARSFINESLKTAAAEERTTCAEAQAVTTRCKALEPRTMKRSQRTPSQAMELERCKLEQDHAQRSCDDVRARIEMLRRRLPAKSEPSTVVCRPG